MNSLDNYNTAKLAHYNAWLLDTKRPFGVAYKGYPEDIKAVKAAAKNVVVAPVVPVKVTGNATKLDQARAIYSRMAGGFSRAEIIARFMEDLNMTKAGASTYWYSVQK